MGGITPNVTPLQGLISTGDVKIAKALLSVQSLPAAQQASQLNTIFQLRDILINELAQRFVSHPWKTQFLMEVSPLVTWLWLGAHHRRVRRPHRAVAGAAARGAAVRRYARRRRRGRAGRRAPSRCATRAGVSDGLTCCL